MDKTEELPLHERLRRMKAVVDLLAAGEATAPNISALAISYTLDEAADALVLREGWRPISEAPKTFRKFGPDSGDGTWDTPWMLCGKHHSWGFCSWVGMLDADSWLGRNDHASCFDTEEPDCWQPLPDPPMVQALPVGGAETDPHAGPADNPKDDLST